MSSSTSPAPAPPSRGTHARALAAALTLTMSAVLPPLLTGTMAERMRGDLGIGETTLGLALAVFFTTSGTLSSRGGRLADRIGWARAGRLAVTGSGLALLGIAVLAHNVWTLMAFLALGGASMGAAMPAGSLAIAQELPIHRQGLLFGVKQTSIPLAGLFAGAAVPVVALTLGWRWAFGIAALFPVLAWALLPADGRTSRPPASASDGSPGELPRAFQILTVGGGLAAIAISAMAAFLVLGAVDAGMAEGRAGALVAVASAVGLTVRVAGGWLADRHGSSGFRPVSVLLLVGAIGFALLALHVPVSISVGAVIAYGAGWGWPGLFYFGAVVHGRHAPAAATGAIQRGLSGGSAIGPLIFGVVAEAAGFPTAWGGSAGLLVAGSILVAVGARRLGAPPNSAGAQT